MAKMTDVGTITVKPDLSEFRQAMMNIAEEFEQRIDAAICRAATAAGPALPELPTGTPTPTTIIASTSYHFADD